MLVLLTLISLVFAEPWGQNDNPSNWGGSLELKFSNLPQSGKLPTQPWSDTYWPSYQSGIAHRWNSQDPQDFNYQLNTKEQVAKLSQDDLAALSPAEKYDIYVGRYDYPLVHSEWQRTHPDDAGWEGLCHGWAPAAIAFKQPKPTTLKNPDGIQIPFGSSDIKALLTYYCAQYDKEPQQQFIADRCNYDIQQDTSKADLPECADINAGTYQVIVANLLGNQSAGFVIDRDRSIQVWNQPMYSFETTIVAQDAKSANLSVKSSYAKETAPQWEAHDAYILTETYSYSVDLDSTGVITGGSHTTWDRPDFAWALQPSGFHGYFDHLQDIYQNATQDYSIRPRPKSISSVSTTTYTSAQGSIVLDGPYPNNHKQKWIIAPSKAQSIKITFLSMDVEKVWDSIGIYEGADGQGALVAVLYGNKVPKEPIVVKSSGAVVFFKSNLGVSGAGFKATYTVE